MEVKKVETVCIDASPPPPPPSPPAPLKNTTCFLAKPPLNLQTVQAPILGNPLLYIGFSWTQAS